MKLKDRVGLGNGTVCAMEERPCESVLLLVAVVVARIGRYHQGT